MIIAILCLFFFVCNEARICPDGAYKCPDWATCCQNFDTSYGCCPYQNAECCSDFIHCCPPDTHCNVINRSCDSSKASSLTFQWMVPQYPQNSTISDAFDDNEISETKLEALKLKDDACPDGTPCKKEATCCPTGEKDFGCCLYPNADCCADYIHCCPDGYVCDSINKQCTKRKHTNSEKNENNLPEINENILPIFNIEKKKFELPLEKLCGSSNPCDLTGKICCSYGNNEFCCPKGSTCLLEDKSCKMADFDSEDPDYFFSKAASNLEDVESKFIVCPDEGQYCPFDTTCCLMLSGKYKCCPMPEATCCPDHVTCCPHNYECVGKDGCGRYSSHHLMHLPMFVERRPFDN